MNILKQQIRQININVLLVKKDVIFRNGKIKQPHFAHHKSDNPCYYYDKPCETQIHKDAKLLMKSLLDNNEFITK